MNALATTFRTILNGLKAVIAQIADKNRPRADHFLAIYKYVSRTITRFETLVTRWQTNTLPKPRIRAPRPARATATPRFPTSRHWLTRDLAHFEANICATRLQAFLDTEDCTKFLAEVPRAARILRPLATALGLQMPGDPPPPPPKPAPTPKPSKTPWLPLPHARVRAENTVEDPLPYPPSFSKAR